MRVAFSELASQHGARHRPSREEVPHFEPKKRRDQVDVVRHGGKVS